MKTVFDVRNEQLNNNEIKQIDSSWNSVEEILKLKSQVNDLTSNLTSVSEEQTNRLNKKVYQLSENIDSRLSQSLSESKTEFSKILSEMNSLKNSLIDKINQYDKEHTERDTQIYNTINSIDEKVNRIYFDVNEYDDHYYIKSIGATGYTEFHKIKKYEPDEETLTYQNGKVKFNYRFSPRNFEIKNNVIRCTGLMLNNGKSLDADLLHNDVKNATYNITSLTHKVEAVLKKLNTVNGYIASNNFKKSTPTQEQLTTFAIECLSTVNNQITTDLIPNGTKIKNTYDNHIWVLNRISIGGLTTAKWEDFGSDNICVASNDGVHGLVTGSHDKLKGHIDLNGVISINGLEEELTSILESLLTITTNISNLEINYNQKLLELENRLNILEER